MITPIQVAADGLIDNVDSLLIFSRGYLSNGETSKESIACIAPRLVPDAIYSRYLPESIISVAHDTVHDRMLDRWIVDRKKVKSISQNTSLIGAISPRPKRGDMIKSVNTQVFGSRKFSGKRTVQRIAGIGKQRPTVNRIHAHPVLCNKRCCNE